MRPFRRASWPLPRFVQRGLAARRSRAPEGSELGETLIEILVTVTILGVSMVAILGALWTTLRVSDFNSKSASGDTALRAYAETMQQGAASDPYHYVPCATVGAYPAYSPPSPYQGYDATVTKIQYLNGFSSDGPIWSDTCPTPDQGLQQITLRVIPPDNHANNNSAQSVTIVKRDATSDLPRCEVIDCSAEESS